MEVGVFSTNSARVMGHPHSKKEKKKEAQSQLHTLLKKLTQNESWI